MHVKATVNTRASGQRLGAGEVHEVSDKDGAFLVAHRRATPATPDEIKTGKGKKTKPNRG